MDCSGKSFTSLPRNISELIQWMNFSNNQISFFNNTEEYLKRVLYLDVSKNILEHISKKTLSILAQSKGQMVDLSNNRIASLPEEIKHIPNTTKLWLSGNPFTCNCGMIWMIDWLNAFFIMDLNSVQCQKNGDRIKHLDPIQMGCYPIWQKIILGVGIGVTVTVVIAIIAISRRWNEVKWLLFLYFNVLGKTDKEEKLENVTFDALLSYR